VHGGTSINCSDDDVTVNRAGGGFNISCTLRENTREHHHHWGTSASESTQTLTATIRPYHAEGQAGRR
jgi:hypothetical protein